jgi:hypothetical protein
MTTSAPIERVNEAITDSLGAFAPEKIFPEVDSFLENLPSVPRGLADAVRKIAGKLDEMPVSSDVPEALREMIPQLEALAERADETFSTFKAKHEQEREQHLNPRSSESAWNV